MPPPPPAAFSVCCLGLATCSVWWLYCSNPQATGLSDEVSKCASCFVLVSCTGLLV
jgi:hypothetical protein